jgi:beta-galactosidase
MLQAGGARTWVAPEINQMNRLPARATAYTFSDAASALTQGREQSPWFKLLNGTWNFQLAPVPRSCS